MTNSAWAHLPNAARIDAVLEHVRQHPQKWTGAWRATRDSLPNSTLDILWDEVRNKTRHATLLVSSHAAWSASRTALLALIAYDDLGHLLDGTTPLDGVRRALKTDNRAVLLLPALIAMRGYEV
jgi:hypothetical protein